MKIVDLVESVLTARQVCAEIKKQFKMDVDLVRGRGYYYFTDKSNTHCLDHCTSTSVMVNSVNQLSLEEWVEEFKDMIEQSK